MPDQFWRQPLVVSQVDGTTLTAAAAASCIPATDRITLPHNFFDIVGKKIWVKASGRISCAVTTPGTARFDLRLGTAGTIVVFDTGALNLNIVAKTTVPWDLEIELTLRARGITTSANLFGQGKFTSEAVIASPLPSVGGNGVLMAPVGTPAVGAGFDSSVANVLDMFFTQTVATGSLTVHQYIVESSN